MIQSKIKTETLLNNQLFWCRSRTLTVAQTVVALRDVQFALGSHPAPAETSIVGSAEGRTLTVARTIVALRDVQFALDSHPAPPK